MGDEAMNLRRGLLGKIALNGLASTTLDDIVLAYAKFAACIDDAQPQCPDMNNNARSDIARRCRVVRAVDLDMPINVYATLDDLIVLETL